ncbi:50S ribosomal protein L29 [Phycisphaerae bacterium]|jgi:large subunit ribosomal protein L29|nr:50S ribosomal protein L29 [Phycisphaerae bacterium]
MTGAEVKALKDDELKLTVAKLRTQLFEMRTKRVTETVNDTSQFSKVRKDVARILTEQTARQKKAAPKK